MARQRTTLLTTTVVSLALLIAACGSDGGSAGASPGTAPDTAGASAGRRDRGRHLRPSAAQANKAAGTITYLSGFDFSASASIVEVIVAKAQGLLRKPCASTST